MTEGTMDQAAGGVPIGEEPDGAPAIAPIPGTVKAKRFRPALRYELIGCGFFGHELVGTDAGALRPEDELFARDSDDALRWYRCLRCDSWLPLAPPSAPTRPFPPAREDIALPLRGRPLRDRIVLRLIAIDRVIHFLLIGSLAVAILYFARHRADLQGDYTRILNKLQAAFGGPFNDTKTGLLHEVNHLVSLSVGRLYLYGAAIGLYAIINAVEAVGLWYAKRWAEYLTVVEASVFIPFEIIELTASISVLKLLALAINVVVVVYLLIAHRLFGIRGGGTRAAEIHDQDVGWAPLERATPSLVPARAIATPCPPPA
jgi:uncharacterized membrane protein (DUF2068 family)